MATPRTACQPQALRDLQRLSPQGHAIYAAMSDKKQFLFFLTCDNVQLGLATAVHESVHMLTEQQDAYPLIGGGSVKRVHDDLPLLPATGDREEIRSKRQLRADLPAPRLGIIGG